MGPAASDRPWCALTFRYLVTMLRARRKEACRKHPPFATVTILDTKCPFLKALRLPPSRVRREGEPRTHYVERTKHPPTSHTHIHIRTHTQIETHKHPRAGAVYSVRISSSRMLSCQAQDLSIFHIAVPHGNDSWVGGCRVGGHNDDSATVPDFFGARSMNAPFQSYGSFRPFSFHTSHSKCACK